MKKPPGSTPPDTVLLGGESRPELGRRCGGVVGGGMGGGARRRRDPEGAPRKASCVGALGRRALTEAIARGGGGGTAMPHNGWTRGKGRRGWLKAGSGSVWARDGRRRVADVAEIAGFFQNVSECITTALEIFG